MEVENPRNTIAQVDGDAYSPPNGTLESVSPLDGENFPPGPSGRRREANRLAAQRFRTRKKGYVDELEKKVAGLEREKEKLLRRIGDLIDTQTRVKMEEGIRSTDGSNFGSSPRDPIQSHPPHLGLHSSRSISPRRLLDQQQFNEMKISNLEDANRHLQQELTVSLQNNERSTDLLGKWRDWEIELRVGRNRDVMARPNEHRVSVMRLHCRKQLLTFHHFQYRPILPDLDTSTTKSFNPPISPSHSTFLPHKISPVARDILLGPEGGNNMGFFAMAPNAPFIQLPPLRSVFNSPPMPSRGLPEGLAQENRPKSSHDDHSARQNQNGVDGVSDGQHDRQHLTYDSERNKGNLVDGNHRDGYLPHSRQDGVSEVRAASSA